MEQQNANKNAQLVMNMYEAFKKGDIPFIISNLSDECEWTGSGEGFLPPGGTYYGKDAASFFKKLNDHEDISAFNVLSVGAINDNEVAAFGNMDIAPRITGRQIFCEWAMHFKFNDEGQVIYFHDFFDTAKAYEAHQVPELETAK